MIDWMYLGKVLLVFGIPALVPVIALLLAAFYSKDGDPRNPGPKCDICGKYLKDHDMYQCETYC